MDTKPMAGLPVGMSRPFGFSAAPGTISKQVTQGDAKVSGLAVLVDGEADIARFREAFASSAGAPPPDGPLHLFRADVREMSVVRPGGDHLDIDWWQSDSGVKHVDRK